MADNNNSQNPKKVYGNFPDPHTPSQQPKGPPRPWTPEMETSADEIVSFLKDSESKKALKDFIISTFKDFESQKVSEIKARVENERKIDEDSKLAPFHTPGNIEPALSEALSMHQTERAFARGLKATKDNLVRCAEERVEEINRLLAGIGGYSSQLKSCFARSTVVFLEQEDPRKPFRERITFSINLPNYELKRNWERTSADSKTKDARSDVGPDGRTPLQATWDDAVNALAQIIASTGLKPKYCKNDRNFGRFVMKQDLRHSSNLPDEYFSFTLDYNTAEKIRDMCVPYNRILNRYNSKIAKLERKLDRYMPDSSSPRFAELKRLHVNVVQERDFFVGTTPDPNQLDEGLLFLIEVSTLKDYHIVKDRMQSIMTKYILHLSRIAVLDAQVDPDLEYEMWKNNNTPRLAHANESKKAQGNVIPLRPRKPGHWAEGMTVEDIQSVPEYEVESGELKPKKKGA